MPWELTGGVAPSPRLDRRRLGITMLGAAGAFVSLALIGLFMAVPFLVQREASAGTAFQLGDLRAVAEIVTERDGRYQLALRLSDVRGAAVDPKMLRVSLVMDGHPMDPGPVPLERTSIGAYRAAGQLTMVGRWRFNVVSERGAGAVTAHYVASF